MSQSIDELRKQVLEGMQENAALRNRISQGDELLRQLREAKRRIAELEREIDGANTDRVAALNRATSAEIECGKLRAAPKGSK